MKKKSSYLWLLLSVGVFFTCKDSYIETTIEPDSVFNPYDTVNYSGNTISADDLDSASFLGLHYYIFSKRCNQPACHDGTFEPDFRTVQSAYNSLVFHTVTKNTPNEDFPYRVTPNDPSLSMMYKRISEHNPPNFEQMPSSGVALPDRQIDLIRQWIVNGAKDISGNNAMLTSTQPNCYGVVAFLPNSSNQRLDTIRQAGQFSSFLAPANQNIQLWFLYLDVNENGDEVLGNLLTDNRIKLSRFIYNYTNALTLNMTMGVNTIASVLSEPFQTAVPYFQNITFKPSDYGFSAGDVIYFRTYVKDSDHNFATEIPKNDSQLALHRYFSMVLY